MEAYSRPETLRVGICEQPVSVCPHCVAPEVFSSTKHICFVANCR